MVSGAAGVPVAVSSFVGRDAERAALGARLAEARLVTLTGAGGSGKTRLAMEVARRVADGHLAPGRFADGVCWVALAAVADAALVPAAVLASLGERPAPARAPAAQLASTLEGRALLLVFDNCEHLVAACAALVEALLRHAPGVAVLATSRESLGVAGERLWAVPTLAVPPPDAAADVPTLLAYDAVRLFAERAAAAAPAFRVTAANAPAVTEICRRLDGLPLALELAAARVRALTPAQIAARLDDCFRLLGAARGAPPHQQTLRATIAWSHDLLPAAERALFARLAVFAGGWTLAAAEAVCADDAPGADAMLDHLSALIDRSMVVAEPAGAEVRYRLLEPVRQFAAEALAARGEADAVRGRHAAHALALAGAAAVHVGRPDRDAVAERLRPELDNLRAALRWTCDHDADAHVRLAATLAWCWQPLGLWDEGRAWCDGALALPAGRAANEARARLLGVVGGIATYQRDFALARDALGEAAALWATLGDDAAEPAREHAHAMHLLVQAHAFEGTPDANARALPMAEASVAAMRALDDRMGLCWALATLGSVRTGLGDLAGARRDFAESHAVAHEVGHLLSMGVSAMALGAMHLLGGDVPGAAALLRESVAAHRRVPEHSYLPMALQATALCAVHAGAPGAAARLLGAETAIRRAVGVRLTDAELAGGLHGRAVAAARAALDAPALAAGRAEGERLSMAAALDLAEAVLAPIADRAGAPPAAPTPPGATPPAPTSARALRVLTLGAVRVERGDGPVSPAAWKYAKSRELLLYLLCHPQGRTREQIGAALWPEASPAQLRQALHPVLHQLRRVLGDPGWIVHRHGLYAFDRARPHVVDADAFEAALDAARAERDPARRREQLGAAVARYDGDFLADAPPAGDWHLARRDALARRYEDALAALAALCAEQGDDAGAAEAWRRLFARDPLDARTCRALLACLGRLDARREARRVWERHAAAVQTELGRAPDDATRAAHERVQRGA